MLQAIKEDLFRYQGSNYRKLSVRFAYIFKPHTRYMWYFRHAQFASFKLTRIFSACTSSYSKISVWSTNSSSNKNRKRFPNVTFWQCGDKS